MIYTPRVVFRLYKNGPEVVRELRCCTQMSQGAAKYSAFLVAGVIIAVIARVLE